MPTNEAIGGWRQGRAGAAPAPAKGLDEVPCHSCTNTIPRDAAICVRCGVTTGRGLEASSPPKDKNLAVMLAAFLAFWTWLYTYERDATKFWIGLVVSMAGPFLLFLPNVAVWVWSIADAARRPSDFYTNFPDD
jgi:hypothetical protein